MLNRFAMTPCRPFYTTALSSSATDHDFNTLTSLIINTHFLQRMLERFLVLYSERYPNQFLY